jgi:aspartyl-tRNA(Asn)/glutamyl-tRNA(Gln) amidotransferase subunit C
MMTTHLLETVEKMAHLSRIAITDEEKTAFASSLSSIIEYFDVLHSFDISSTAAMYSVLENQTLPLREDITSPPLSKEAFLKNAPSSVGGLIKVPQVFKQ